MASFPLSELGGKRASIEVREGRRWHRMVFAQLEFEGDQLYAIFASSHSEHYPEPFRIRIPEEQMGHFRRVSNPDCDFKLESVLYRYPALSDDAPAGLQPPIIVTQADIDASKNEIAEPIVGTDSCVRHVSCGAGAAPSLERFTSTLDPYSMEPSKKIRTRKLVSFDAVPNGVAGTVLRSLCVSLCSRGFC